MALLESVEGSLIVHEAGSRHRGVTARFIEVPETEEDQSVDGARGNLTGIAVVQHLIGAHQAPSQYPIPLVGAVAEPQGLVAAHAPQPASWD